MTHHDGGQHDAMSEETCCTVSCVRGPSRRQALQAGGVVMASGTLVACGGAQDPASDPGTEDGAEPGDDTVETPDPAETDSPDPTETDSAATRVPLSDTPVGGSTYYPQEGFIVAHPSEGEVRVYDATCTHEGCQVSETGAEGTLVCPCHGSVFASDSGEVLSGPASGPLTTLEAEVDGADVVLSG